MEPPQVDGNSKIDGAIIFTKNDDVAIQPTSKLIGLTKEQLEQYRNDPFWKAIRYIMFTLFWLVWLAMFVGAVLIVVLSPKCSRSGPKCDNNLINYRIFTPAFFDTSDDGVGDFRGIEAKLGELRKVGVTGISPTPLFQVHADEQFSPEEVVDATVVEPRFGTEAELRSLINAVHHQEMSFIADVPLTVSAENQWFQKVAAEPEYKKSKSDGDGAVVLDVENGRVQSKLVEVAHRLLQLGADGLYFTDYGLSSDASQRGSLDPIIQKVLSISATDKSIGQKHVAVFVDASWSAFTRLANFSAFPLVNSDDVFASNASLIAHVTRQIDAGMAGIRQQTDAKPLRPLWKYADVSTSRLDQLLSGEEKKMAIRTLHLIELFLPGPAQVYYGEEFGLPSANGVFKNRGQMRWSAGAVNAGFSANQSSMYLFGDVSAVDSAAAFEDDLAKSNSHIQAFKSLVTLRFKNPVFEAGELLTKTVDSKLHLFSRHLPGDANAEIFILAVNWPLNEDAAETVSLTIPGNLTNDRSLKNVEVKVASPSMELADNFIDLEEEKIPLKPYEAVVLRI